MRVWKCGLYVLLIGVTARPCLGKCSLSNVSWRMARSSEVSAQTTWGCVTHTSGMLRCDAGYSRAPGDTQPDCATKAERSLIISLSSRPLISATIAWRIDFAPQSALLCGVDLAASGGHAYFSTHFTPVCSSSGGISRDLIVSLRPNYLPANEQFGGLINSTHHIMLVYVPCAVQAATRGRASHRSGGRSLAEKVTRILVSLHKQTLAK